MRLRQAMPGVTVAQPILSKGTDPALLDGLQRRVLDEMLASSGVREMIAWYYTPLAIPFTSHLDRRVIVYDCMDELSGFRGASPRLALLERHLLKQAHVVFTGGVSLYRSKRGLHRNVHAFPSSIDAAHFGKARSALPEPSDQASVPRPRVGFFGVVDERMDTGLVEAVARLRPEISFVMIGPVVKIDPASLPRLPNIHWLGMKAYAELPSYLAGWQAGFMPFAMNEATRFISPTKTPEYLAAGVPVVSTPIADVVDPYGKEELVAIAGTPEAMAAALDRLLAGVPADWRARVDLRLRRMSWNRTWSEMLALIEEAERGSDAVPAERAQDGAAHV
ncbi:MAG TPA: glycosyltransferase [Acetobacteraceae bacterium]|nr:glycosyltransferase [Acetobacteraceae bacterium]